MRPFGISASPARVRCAHVAPSALRPGTRRTAQRTSRSPARSGRGRACAPPPAASSPAAASRCGSAAPRAGEGDSVRRRRKRRTAHGRCASRAEDQLGERVRASGGGSASPGPPMRTSRRHPSSIRSSAPVSSASADGRQRHRRRRGSARDTSADAPSSFDKPHGPDVALREAVDDVVPEMPGVRERGQPESFPHRRRRLLQLHPRPRLGAAVQLLAHERALQPQVRDSAACRSPCDGSTAAPGSSETASARTARARRPARAPRTARRAAAGHPGRARSRSAMIAASYGVIRLRRQHPGPTGTFRSAR